MTTAARRCASVPVDTVYGKGELLGKDGRGQACVIFKPGDAPELEKAHWRGGPCYALMISESDIKERMEG